MARKKTKISRGDLFARLLLASAVLLFIPQKQTGHLNWLFYTVFGQVLTLTQGRSPEFFKPIYSEEDFVPRYNYYNLEKEYNNVLMQIEKLRSEYEQLSSVRKNISNENVGIILAKVIPTSHSGIDELVINKGKLDGLRSGQYVLIREGNCAIGTISEISDSIAKVKLVTASKHNLPVLIWREGKPKALPGQLVGNGNDTAHIPLISKDKDIQAGDIVYADARAGYLHSPITVGRVSEVEIDKNTPLLLDIQVKPIDDLTKVQSVIVIVMDAKMKFIDRQEYSETEQ